MVYCSIEDYTQDLLSAREVALILSYPQLMKPSVEGISIRVCSASGQTSLIVLTLEHPPESETELGTHFSRISLLS